MVLICALGTATWRCESSFGDLFLILVPKKVPRFTRARIMIAPVALCPATSLVSAERRNITVHSLLSAECLAMESPGHQTIERQYRIPNVTQPMTSRLQFHQSLRVSDGLLEWQA